MVWPNIVSISFDVIEGKAEKLKNFQFPIGTIQ